MFLVFTIALLPVIFIFWNSEKKFRKNSTQCNAFIVGYVREDNTRWDTPQVILEADEQKKIYRCNSKHMDASTYPHGTQVRVEYCKKKVFGREFLDIRMVDSQFAPYPASITLIVICVLTVIFLTVSIMMFMIGIRSIEF